MYSEILLVLFILMLLMSFRAGILYDISTFNCIYTWTCCIILHILMRITFLAFLLVITVSISVLHIRLHTCFYDCRYSCICCPVNSAWFHVISVRVVLHTDDFQEFCCDKEIKWIEFKNNEKNVIDFFGIIWHIELFQRQVKTCRRNTSRVSA